MNRKALSWFLSLCVGAVSLGACTNLEPGGSNVSEGTEVGSLKLNLDATGPSGTQYRLISADFLVTPESGGGPSVTINGDSPTVTTLLPINVYTLELLTGWRIERFDAGTWVSVEATLLTPQPQTIQIFEGRTSEQIYQFVVGGEVITTGQGTLAVTADISEDPAGCTLDETIATEILTPDEVRNNLPTSLTVSALLDDVLPDQLTIALYDGYGVFANGIRTGTFEITDDETNYWTCGLCVWAFGNTDNGVAQETYVAKSGTVTITSLEGDFQATVENAVLQHVYVSGFYEEVQVDAPDQCTTTLNTEFRGPVDNTATASRSAATTVVGPLR